MKIQSSHITKILFFLVMIFYVIPPLFVSSVSSDIFTVWNFPYLQITRAFTITAVIFIRSYVSNPRSLKFTISFNLLSIFSDTNSKTTSLSISKKISYTFLTFVFLCASAFIFELLGKYFNVTFSMKVLPPTSAKEWCFCILTYLCAAFFEEAVYRFYVVQSTTNDFLCPRYVGEILAVILFAMSHKYLGALAVINAAVAGVILRICFIKTKSIATCVAAHFIYNMSMLLIFCFIANNV